MTASTIVSAPEDQGRPETPAMRQQRWRTRLLACLSVLAGTAAIGAHAALYGYWIVDDAAITFAYARSVTEGWGFVVQQGAAPVEGFSNPTWLALLSLGRLVGLFDHGTLFGIPDYAVYPKALALLCCASLLVGCYFAAKKVTRWPWLATLASGIILAAIPSFVMWSFSGLENSLYALTVVWLAVLVFRAVIDDRLLGKRVAIVAGLLAAVAALTRPDGLIYAGAYPLVALAMLFRANNRPRFGPSLRYALLSVAAFAAPVGGYFLWRHFHFGRWLPNTAVAKSQDIPGLADIARLGELVNYIGAPLILLMMIIGTLVLRRPFWWRRGLVALLVPLSLAVLAFVVLNPDWMVQYRFATPAWAMLALVGPLVTAEALRGLRPKGTKWLGLGLVITLLISGATLLNSFERARETLTVPMCYVADRLGRVFNGYADILGLQHGSLLLPDLGGSSLTSRLRLYDMAGLVSPKIADYIKADDLEGLRDYIFTDVKPTFIHSRGPWAAGNGITSDPRIERDYYPIYIYPESDPPNGDWVRKDAVSSQQELAQLRAYAQSHAVAVDNNADEWPQRQCGTKLRPGQTAVGLH